MARLFIANTNELGKRDGALVPIYKGSSDIAYSSLDFSGGVQTSNALSAKYARIGSDAACLVAVNETASATGGSEVGFYLPASGVIDLELDEDSTISVIAAA